MKNFRQMEIFSLLEKEKVVNTQKLAAHFGVAVETIRRDLDQMEKRGVLRKIYGGAEYIQPEGRAPEPREARLASQNAAKHAIARKAAEYIEESCTIALDAGSTIFGLLPYLNQMENLIIVCQDVYTAQKLLEQGRNRVVITGGFLTADGTSDGSFSGDFFESLAGIDLFLLSADGADPGSGISSDEPGIHQLKKEFLKRSRKKIALLDHTKFQREGFYKTCRFEELDLVITDSGTPEEIIARVRAAGTEVIVVEV